MALILGAFAAYVAAELVSARIIYGTFPVDDELKNDILASIKRFRRRAKALKELG